MKWNKREKILITTIALVVTTTFTFKFAKKERYRQREQTEFKPHNKMDSVVVLTKSNSHDSIVDYIKAQAEYCKYERLQDQADLNYRLTCKKKYRDLFYNYDTIRVRWAKTAAAYERALYKNR